MNIKPLVLLVSLSVVSGNVLADDYLEGYYGAIKLLHARQSAEDMDTSSRPGVGDFVSGDEKHNFYNGLLLQAINLAMAGAVRRSMCSKRKANTPAAQPPLPAATITTKWTLSA